jgi:hypothetical protein
MTVVITIFYILFACLALGYAVVNAFHFIRFRLPLNGDLSLVLLLIYLFVSVGVLVSSIVFGFIALKL